MGRILYGKTLKDIEAASETIINPGLPGSSSGRAGKSAATSTIPLQISDMNPLEDMPEKRNQK